MRVPRGALTHLITHWRVALQQRLYYTKMYVQYVYTCTYSPSSRARKRPQTLALPPAHAPPRRLTPQPLPPDSSDTIKTGTHQNSRHIISPEQGQMYGGKTVRVRLQVSPPQPAKHRHLPVSPLLNTSSSYFAAVEHISIIHRRC